uniref:LacI family DNA-binding transcriptional regulator n=1 Tax=Paenarthrobacter ureafaciens TaxID=37931 RepID=UPI000B145332
MAVGYFYQDEEERMWERSQKLATVDDVADLAGVSKSTAARVLGGYGSSSMSTRAAVHAAAATLGYRPNASAKTINTGRSESIGVISRNIGNPGFGIALDGIMSVTSGAGVSVIVAGSEFDIDLERSAVELLLRKRVDALIVSPAHGDVGEHLQAAHSAGVPILLWERRVKGLEVPVIESDMAGAGRILGQHLLNLGHKRVGFVSTFPYGRQYELGDDTGSSVINDRLQAIFGTFAEAGLPPSTDLIRFASRSAAGIHDAVIDLIEQEDPPTVLIASDGQIGLETLTALRARGLSIPQDMSLVLFEDAPWAKLVDPPLTVVSQPTHEMGRVAAEVALASVGAEKPLRRIPPFAAQLVIRDSVGPAADRAI